MISSSPYFHLLQAQSVHIPRCYIKFLDAGTVMVLNSCRDNFFLEFFSMHIILWAKPFCLGALEVMSTHWHCFTLKACATER